MIYSVHVKANIMHVANIAQYFYVRCSYKKTHLREDELLGKRILRLFPASIEPVQNNANEGSKQHDVDGAN